MSFWDSVKKLAQPYDDDDYEEDEDLEEFAEKEDVEERPARPRRTPPFANTNSESAYAPPASSAGAGYSASSAPGSNSASSCAILTALPIPPAPPIICAPARP